MATENVIITAFSLIKNLCLGFFSSVQAEGLFRKMQQKHRIGSWKQNANEEILVSKRRFLVKKRDKEICCLNFFQWEYRILLRQHRENYFLRISCLMHATEVNGHTGKTVLPDWSENLNRTLKTRLKIWTSVVREGSRMINNIASITRFSPQRALDDPLLQLPRLSTPTPTSPLFPPHRR